MRIASIGAAVVATMISAPASAQMSLEAMSKANGLAEIINKSKPCGYAVNQAALEQYYVENGLANPEVLSFIASAISLAEFGDSPTETDCTMARVTARQMGILAQ